MTYFAPEETIDNGKLREALNLHYQAMRGMLRWETLEAKQEALDAVLSGLRSANERVQQAAVRNLIAMEKQNQTDEHESRRPKIATSLHINASVSSPHEIEQARQLALERRADSVQ